MIKLLKSGWVAALLGCILFAATMVASWKSVSLSNPKSSAAKQAKPTTISILDPASYADVDLLVAELRREREGLAAREKQLTEWQSRLEAERSELKAITQSVDVVKAQIEKELLQIRNDETKNLKSLAKTVAAMAPESAAELLQNFDDTQIAKTLVFMKETEVAKILEAFTSLGPAGSKRAAAITERLRLTQIRAAAEKTKS